AYLHLFDCRQRFDLGEPLEELLAGLPGEPYANPWLEGRRVKLLFQFAQHCEKQRDFDLAQRLYRQSSHPGARLRAIRSLERGERFAEAHALAREASCAPESDAERQGLARLLPRLQSKLGLPRQARAAAPEIDRLDLCLAYPSEPCSVEWAVREHLEEPDCAVHYVENGLINSLFGLLCWEAIFAAIPGAFFHPFHSAPADLHSADFRQRRAALFEACLGRLEDGSYRDAIRCRYRDKFGLQSPFVYWELLGEELLEQALDCLPAAHLRAWFERLLEDIPGNRAGLPDLIQFWPAQRRYRMVEVKGPGDRLQDNQLRWLQFCREREMPVAVCYV
ncbi:nuclease, partial [Pseudomonas aeruginosa]